MKIDLGTYGAKRQSWVTGHRRIMFDVCVEHPHATDEEILRVFEKRLKKALMHDQDSEVCQTVAHQVGLATLQAIKPMTIANPDPAADIMDAPKRKRSKAKEALQLDAVIASQKLAGPSVFDNYFVRDGRALSKVTFGELRGIKARNDEESKLIDLILRHAKGVNPDMLIEDAVDSVTQMKFIKKVSPIAG